MQPTTPYRRKVSGFVTSTVKPAFRRIDEEVKALKNSVEGLPSPAVEDATLEEIEDYMRPVVDNLLRRYRPPIVDELIRRRRNMR